MKINDALTKVDLITWKKETLSQTGKNEESISYSEKETKTTIKGLDQKEIPQPKNYRAFFAVDDKNNVVIRIVDDKNNVIRQIPPEEYIKQKEALRETIKNLFHLEA